MPEFPDTTPVPTNMNAVRITSVVSGDCIGLEADVTVSYSNVNLNPASIGLGCTGAAAPGDQAVGFGSGTRTFHLVHGAAAAGHTLTADLKQNGVPFTSDSVGPVGIGNPCPIDIGDLGGPLDGLSTLDPTKPLAGTFDVSKGNRVVLLVEVPAGFAGANYRPAMLVFAAPADVNAAGKQGTWKHDAIPNARKGQQLRVVLTKDGAVRATVRAVFR
jgi:hypothetical protein